MDPIESFKGLVFPSERREVIRWFLKDYESPTENILKVLRIGLKDDDWEVRLTTMIAIAKYDLAEFITEVRKCELPTATISGLTKPLLRSIITLKKVILSYLTTFEIPENPGKDLSSKSAFADYLLRIVLDKDVSVANDHFLLIKSLIQPISPKLNMERIPNCLQTIDGGLFLKETKIEMVYVPPYSHWIGGDEFSENPIKLVKTKEGFFISKDPLRGPKSSEFSNEFMSRDFNGALRYVEMLKDLVDYPLAMPNTTATEMAIRGHNGRLYPWGNSLDKNDLLISPWGVNFPLGSIEYWTSTNKNEDEVYTFGSKKHQFCAQRVAQRKSALCAIRITLK